MEPHMSSPSPCNYNAKLIKHETQPLTKQGSFTSVQMVHTHTHERYYAPPKPPQKPPQNPPPKPPPKTPQNPSPNLPPHPPQNTRVTDTIQAARTTTDPETPAKNPRFFAQRKRTSTARNTGKSRKNVRRCAVSGGPREQQQRRRRRRRRRRRPQQQQQSKRAAFWATTATLGASPVCEALQLL